ncbi:MAG: hypothetical protein J0H32_01625 [Rhizobiales bacterium]|nr:hypothetical protein [Hyphomicrobiales bacterium]MBN8983176.1 hypothetical protein [Hyphomicrobiales bacterium]
MSWDAEFLRPIALPTGKKAATLRQAAEYIQKLPKSEQAKAHWTYAVDDLIAAAEHRVPIMHAEIAVNRALTPDEEPRYGAGKAVGPDMKFHRRRKLVRDR